MVISKLIEHQEWVLTEEGKSIAKDGSHEAKVFHAIPEAGIAQTELNVLFCFSFLSFLFFSFLFIFV